MIPSRTDGGPDISFVNIPSVIDGSWPNLPSIIGGTWPNPNLPISISIPNFNLPPISFSSPICISGTPFPPISFSPFPPITLPSFIDLKLEPTIAEKCKLVLEKIVELANEGKPIGFEQDFGGWTATITKGKMHTHVGIPGKEGNFDILVNNLYDLLIKGQGLSWA